MVPGVATVPEDPHAPQCIGKSVTPSDSALEAADMTCFLLLVRNGVKNGAS